MDFELRRAREKLEKEQKERKERARRKLEKERKAKQEALLQRQAIEESQRERRIMAAEAEAKAKLMEDQNLIAGRGIVFSRILEAVPYQGSGDKIKLPPSAFEELSEKQAFDKGPLHFSLSLILDDSSGTQSSEKRSTHAGVLEFSASEGFLELPPHCWTNLIGSSSTASSNSKLVEVRYVWIPKGSYAKLQPAEIGFSDVPNHKAVLETSLRQHATLSQGDILTVTYGVLVYHLQVLELKPSASVSVLETDIEVDIVGSETGENSSQFVLKPIILKKPELGVVNEGCYSYYKFNLSDDTWRQISSGETNLAINLVPQSLEGDSDLYVSKHPLLFPTVHQHTWSSHDVGSKMLVLSSKDQNFGPGTYTIAVFGFKGTPKFELSVDLKDPAKPKPSLDTASSSVSAADDSAMCSNCNRFVPSRSVALHEAYCIRHNTVCGHAGCGIVLRIEEAGNHVHCEKCGKAFHSREIEKHVKVFHEPLSCPCGIILEKEQMVHHKSLQCPLRLIMCRFCGDMVEAGSPAGDARDRMRGLTEHESLCGSRTAPCDSCGRSVMLKDMDIHQVAVHQKN